MLTYDLNERQGKPLYEYLYGCIKRDILEGKIKPEEKLPSKRSLAKHLNISVITVENAYAQLLLEGYLYSVETKGYFACRLERAKMPVKEPERVEAEEEFEYQFFADFRANRMRRMNFPFSVWSKLMREVLSSQDEALLKTVPYNGVYILRCAIAEYLYEFRRMSVSPDQIIIGAGTEYLYGRLIQLMGTGCIYGVEDPGYKKIPEIYERNGVKWEYLSTDNGEIEMENLKRSGCNMVHVSPAHCFPLGIVMPVKKRQELLQWAKAEKNRYIIEDDYDCEFRYDGKPIPPMQSMDGDGKVIYMNTFSKSLVPSIRISYLVLPKHLMEKYVQSMSFYSCTVPSFEQYTLAKFISEGYFERHINRMKNHYKSQRNRLVEEIKKSPLAQISSIHEENAGTHFLLRIKTAIPDKRILEEVRKRDMDISCLSEYYANPLPDMEHTLVINYAGIHKERIKEAVDRLSAVFTEENQEEKRGKYMDSYRLRKVKMQDAEKLLEWTNEEETRKNSFSKEPVAYENHIKWLEKKLEDTSCFFYILVQGKTDMGTVRVDVDPERKTGIISYNIAKEHRGKGLGKKIIALIEKAAQKEIPVHYLEGSVKPSNKASAKCFLNNGYEQTEKNKEKEVYCKKI